MGKLRIALLSGGWSGEREVSLKSGDGVFNALDKSKYEVSRYDPRDDLDALVKEREKIDLAFVLLHGKLGEDGCMQGFLEILRIPYVGSAVLPSAMAFNKKIAKDRYRSAGLCVIEDVVLREGEDFSVAKVCDTLGSSTVVKPVAEGSSLGASICHSPEELAKGTENAFRYDQEIMVERYVRGRELTCCILGNRATEALPVVEIVPNPEYSFFDYEAKYRPGATKEICPARLSEAEASEAQSCARKAHEVLKCRVWSRTDMIKEGERIYVLETNTLPGMTETSLVPLAARAAGIPFSKLLDRLIELSLEEKSSAQQLESGHSKHSPPFP